MFCKGLFYILALTPFTHGVKVNMHGSLSLGKEVMDTLSHYLMNGYRFSGRRSLDDGRRSIDDDPIINEEPISTEIQTASICKKLELCINGRDKFVNEYVTSLGKAIEAVFEGIISEKDKDRLNKIPIFTRLKGSLHDARKILKTATRKINDDNEAYIWMGVVKRLSSLFQSKSVTFIIDGLDADKKVAEIKKKLKQKLVTNIAEAETKAEKRLCNEYHLCLQALGCTKSLNTMMKKLIASPDDRIKKFMKAFFEALPETTFYSTLDEVTANEFQDILNDMAFFDNVPTRDILKSFQQTVEIRLNSTIDPDLELEKGKDVQLVYIILSDMDYIYSKQKSEPFGAFLDYFSDWVKTGGKISSQVKDVVKTIDERLKEMADDIVVKLIDEVRVFLEITVDP